MAQNSKISWTDHTVNLWWGCSKVHTGCKNCYAESLSKKVGNDIWGDKKPRKFVKSAYKDLDKYQKIAKNTGKMQKVFVGSMMDIFEDEKTLIDHQGRILEGVTTAGLRESLFAKIDAGRYDGITFLFLTKRTERINLSIPLIWQGDGIPSNVWFGTSISDQDTADVYMPRLVRHTPILANRFLSVEPQVENIDLSAPTTIIGGEEYKVLPAFDWVIQGCESGSKKRPFELEWAYDMSDVCEKNHIPYFLKQIQKDGRVVKDINEFPEGLQIQEFPREMKKYSN